MKILGKNVSLKRGILYCASKHCFDWLPDETFVKLKYHVIFEKKLNLRNPKTYNEKLQWLKLYDRNPEYAALVDKYTVKQIVAQKIGEEHIIPTLGVWDSFDEIDFSMLPKQFVLKCTHDSGGVVICTDKDHFDVATAKRKLEKNLKANYYKENREWPYKLVKPRIIAEQYMVDESGYELKDYKFFCFHGKPELLLVVCDRTRKDQETKSNFYDMDFRFLPVKSGHPNAALDAIRKPSAFEEMKQLASVLSQGYPELRVDFYEINGKVYFGELTFYHWSGFVPFEPQEWDEKIGAYIQLPQRQC